MPASAFTWFGTPVVGALRPSDVAWAAAVALVVWGLGWAVIAALTRRQEGRREPEAPGRAEPPIATGEEHTSARAAGESEGVAGVLRWLLAETDAEAAAFLRLAPGGGERFVVEPRGLEPQVVSSLARIGREALTGEGERMPRGIVTTRWLGIGGTKSLVLRGSGTTLTGTEEPLRFARFAIEWAGAPPEPSSVGIEEQARALSGVAWAELDADGRLRVLPAEKVEHAALERALAPVLAGTGIRVRWVEPADRNADQRARLVAVELNGDGQAAAQVQLDWQGQELRGRGYGAQTRSGRCHAAALAVADALGPLIAGEVRLEGVYTQAQAGQEVVVAVVQVGGQRLVGAVPLSPTDAGQSGARAVLDAVNRRLAVIAGGSGQL